MKQQAGGMQFSFLYSSINFLLVSPGGHTFHEEDPRGCRGLQCTGGRTGLPGEAHRGLCPPIPCCAAHWTHWGSHTYQVDAHCCFQIHKQWFSCKIMLCKFNNPGRSNTTLTRLLTNIRFLFILLGPDGKAQQYHEIGRSMATIMTDEVRKLCQLKSSSATCILQRQATKFPLFFSGPDLPRRSLQGKGQKWPAGWNRWVSGPGDGPATGRVGPLHPHRAPKECPISGTQPWWHRDFMFQSWTLATTHNSGCKVDRYYLDYCLFLDCYWIPAGEEEDARSP